jgi:uncharacterized DUF497 family protein
VEPLLFEWDESKRVENLAKHGIDFNAAVDFGWKAATLYLDRRRNYGEERLVAYGPIDGRLCVLVYARRGARRRVISLRKANRREQAKYAAAVLAGRVE